MSKKELYRDTANGKISGVCAGLANYLGIEVWLVRILVISAALLGGSFMILLAYVAMTFMVEKQPAAYVEDLKAKQEHQLKSKPWQQGKTPQDLISTLERDFDKIEDKIRHMEAYVTSGSYKVDREFKNL
ncbi:envelope stress response membrane protein PspC [Vibrio sonorensis]|uniref:envelope stress response membrane protein PspC n=1 Tax=Vibrio sonorensis TaxID=1004316 RepID=UPI0008D9A21F|nr:envelope stress response membrane protein PspC [Vibrio sonorensis]